MKVWSLTQARPQRRACRRRFWIRSWRTRGGWTKIAKTQSHRASFASQRRTKKFLVVAYKDVLVRVGRMGPRYRAFPGAPRDRPRSGRGANRRGGAQGGAGRRNSSRATPSFRSGDRRHAEEGALPSRFESPVANEETEVTACGHFYCTMTDRKMRTFLLHYDKKAIPFLTWSLVPIQLQCHHIAPARRNTAPGKCIPGRRDLIQRQPAGLITSSPESFGLPRFWFNGGLLCATSSGRPFFWLFPRSPFCSLSKKKRKPINQKRRRCQTRAR
jgi:hypothetical protein